MTSAQSGLYWPTGVATLNQAGSFTKSRTSFRCLSFSANLQSETERKFAEKLKQRNDVRLFVKLPAWFKVATPVGQYNPDWALVMEEVDAHGDPGPLLYLVRETKSTTVADELRGTENQKIHCGEQHFRGALGVDYRVVTSADELP